MDTSHYSVERLRSSLSGQGDREATTGSPVAHASLLSNNAHRATLRRRLRPSVSRLDRLDASEHDQRQGAAMIAAIHSSFRPLDLTLPSGVTDWNIVVDGPSEAAQDGHGQAPRTPFRARPISRRNRRLFASSSGSNDRRRDAISTAVTRGSITGTSSTTLSPSRAFSPGVDAPPRLEISEHGLHSFKRSFEQAAPRSASGGETTNDPTALFTETSPSGSSASFSSSSPPFSEGNPSRSREQHTLFVRSTSPLSSHVETEGSLSVPLPESWLRQAEDHQAIGSSTSVLRHSPPTPDNAGFRVKRRRSRTGDGPAREQAEVGSPTANISTARALDPGWYDFPAATETGLQDMLFDESVADAATDQQSLALSQDSATASESGESVSWSVSPAEERAEAALSLSRLNSPTNSTSVSIRRGLHRQFSLGTLPLFHFEEDEAEDGSSETTSDNEELQVSANTASLLRIPGERSVVPARSRLPRQPRRPYLQRNTTAVSPPEESPLNTPEGTNEQRDAEANYPGFRQWHASADRANSTARTARGAFIQSQTSAFYGLHSRLGDQAPRLSLDFDIGHSATQQDTPILQSDMSQGLDMSEPAGNGRTQSTTAATTASTSSSLGTGWQSEVERSRAEQLSDHLETSRRIAADVQRLQARLDASPALSRTSEVPSPFTRGSQTPVDTIGAVSTSIAPPRISLSSAVGSSSRGRPVQTGATGTGTSGLWGEVDLTPAAVSSPMTTATASITLQPNFTRRPGALGRSNMRGPTRSSNEAWMRSQGIDFYDSLQSNRRSRHSEGPVANAAPISVLPTSRIPAPTTTPTLPSGRRTSPTHASRLSSLSPVASVSTFTAASIPRRQAPNESEEDAWRSPSTGSRPTVAERVARNNLPGQIPWRHSSSRTPPAGHPGTSQPNSHATGSFIPVTSPAGSSRSPGPQLEAIRPLSPFFQRRNYALHSENRQGQNTLVTDVAGDNVSTAAAHPLSTSLNNSREPMSWLQAVQAIDAERSAAGETMVRSYHNAGAASNNEHTSNEQLPYRTPNDNSPSIPTLRQSLQARDAERASTRETWLSARRSSSNPSSHSNSVTEWFRRHTNEISPDGSSTSDISPSAQGAANISPSAQTAADETEEASDGIAAAVRRLDDVRRLLDEVEQNMQRRRQSYEARASEQPSEQYRQSRRALRDISAIDSRDHATARHPLDTGSPSLYSRLPSIRAPPVTSVARSNPLRTSIPARTGVEAVSIPVRPRSQQRHPGSRPTLQPFEEIFAEVEAEFSQRDRTRSTGERLSGTRPLLHGLSRERRQGAEGSAAPYQPRELQATPELSTSSLETIQNELTRLRQRLQRDWGSQQSGFALQDSTNTGLSDIAGLRARQSASPDLDFDLFALEAATIDSHEQAASERVPLPPFLLRSLRARRQATFGHREGGSDIASELGNYAGDLDLDMSYEGLLSLSERLGEVKRRGATDEALSRGLTSFTYAQMTLDVTSLEDRETRCAICLEDYEDEDVCARSTKCGHALHEECLTTWLRRNDTCPICRQTAV